MIHHLTDTIELTVYGWTLCLILAFVAGLATGLWLRRPKAQQPRRRTAHETDTLDGTETVTELARRCL